MKNFSARLKCAVWAVLAMGIALGAGAASVEYVTPTYVGGVAANGIAYWTTNTVSTYTVVGTSSSAVTWGVSGATKWYVVNGTVQIDGGVTCAGHVNLILCEGAKLTVTNVADKAAGIMTDVNGSFTVYGQPVAAASPSLLGELYVYGGIGGAAIGGGYRGAGSNITINGGAVTAIGGAKGSSGSSSFNGAAGIGGGHEGSGSNITINGGTVTATGGYLAAGIGGGYNKSKGTACGCNITINGGRVDSKGNVRAAGIGGGQNGDGFDITINGGTVKSTGEKNAAGIGGGYKGAGDTDSYAGYYCTVATALDLFGGTSVSAIESYLNAGDHFSEVKAKAAHDSVAFSDGEYHILDYTSEAFTVADYIAIAFYGNEAYRVYGYESGVGGSAALTPNGQLAFNESYAASGSVGTWQQAVPEPTSGLLLLLGMAGLALRRRKN